MKPDYQRPEGTPEPEGGTIRRTPFPGWLRRSAAEGPAAWFMGSKAVRAFKMATLLHQIDKGKRPHDGFK